MTGAATEVAVVAWSAIGTERVRSATLTLISLSTPGRFFCPSGVPNALLSILTGTVTDPSSGEAGLSGLTSSSAEAMPVPSISKPPVTSAV